MSLPFWSGWRYINRRTWSPIPFREDMNKHLQFALKRDYAILENFPPS